MIYNLNIQDKKKGIHFAQLAFYFKNNFFKIVKIYIRDSWGKKNSNMKDE